MSTKTLPFTRETLATKIEFVKETLADPRTWNINGVDAAILVLKA